MGNGTGDPDGRSWDAGLSSSQPIPQAPAFASYSERKYVAALTDQLPGEATLLAQLRFTDRTGDDGADLVVVWPGYGIAVIVLNGALISYAEGQWRHPSKNPQGWEPLDLVAHAVKAKNSLREYLHQHPRWTRGNPRIVHMVALPASQLDADFDAPDAPRWRVMDHTDMAEVAQRIATALRLVAGEPNAPTKDDAKAILNCLAGVAIPQRQLLERLSEREDSCELLSDDQAHVIDVMDGNTRVEIRGGAGSGKTWLAVEKARRLSGSGKRVALLCQSPGLAEFLIRRVSTLARAQRPAYVGTFQSLVSQWGVPGPRHGSPDPEQRLPDAVTALAKAQPLGQRFDAIVIDEAEDVAPAWWPAILAALRNPDIGELYAFSDELHKAIVQPGHPMAPPEAFDLTENLRNTKNIAQTFRGFAPGVMRPRGDIGAPVRFVQCPAGQAISMADEATQALLRAGWPGQSLAVLTTLAEHPLQIEQQAAGSEAYWHSFWEGDEPFYGQVLDFKGLERPAVMLAIDGFRDERGARETAYVGLSRARDLLVVCGDIEMIRREIGDDVANRLLRSGKSATAGKRG